VQGVAENNCGSRQPTSGGPPGGGLGETIATPRHKSLPYYETFNDISEWSFANAVVNLRVP